MSLHTAAINYQSRKSTRHNYSVQVSHSFCTQTTGYASYQIKANDITGKDPKHNIVIVNYYTFYISIYGNGKYLHNKWKKPCVLGLSLWKSKCIPPTDLLILISSLYTFRREYWNICLQYKALKTRHFPWRRQDIRWNQMNKNNENRSNSSKNQCNDTCIHNIWDLSNVDRARDFIMRHATFIYFYPYSNYASNLDTALK